MKTDAEYYEDNEISPQRELAIEILEEFEDLLDEHDLTIPDKDRGEIKDKDELTEEARIYGTTYYHLEDKLTELIERYLKKDKK